MTLSVNFLSLFLKNLHWNWQDIRALIGHDIRITHDMNHVLEISFCDI